MGSGVKCVDRLDPRGPVASCYAAYRLSFNLVSVVIINLATTAKFPVL